MDFFDLLTMVGGLALFLYGMHLLSEGLEKLSGGRLERVLENLTNNRLKAVLLGAGVTAVIQSSSATTVMVVGFVNSGIMKLSQAIGIIMGANVGTTITSWVLSLTGIESDSFFLQLVKPTSFSPVLAAIGVIFIMFMKNGRKRELGTILVGFAILMTGMDTMSSAVKPLSQVPEFTGLFTMFTNPLLGLLVGALVTAVIQSSSASVGILQALCVTGSINYAAAVPIILGQNIGTCVTAMMSVYVFGFPKYHADQVMDAYFALIYAPVMLSFVLLTRQLDDGIYLVWMIFISSWISDTFAYLAGVMLGRHKLAPVLSPKKSVEGSVGGIVGAALFGALFGAYLDSTLGQEQYVMILAVVGGVGSVISQVGDLAASAIKRNHEIKDYGNLIPGHGGIMDRFDSVIFTAPITYFLITILMNGHG